MRKASLGRAVDVLRILRLECCFARVRVCEKIGAKKPRRRKKKLARKNDCDRGARLGVDGLERLDVGTPPLHQQLDALVAGRDFGMKDLQALPVHLRRRPRPEVDRPAGMRATGVVDGGTTREIDRSTWQ